MDHHLGTLLPESLQSERNRERLNAAFAQSRAELLQDYSDLSEIFSITAAIDNYWSSNAYDALLDIVRRGSLREFRLILVSLQRTGDLTHQMCSRVLFVGWLPPSPDQERPRQSHYQRGRRA